MFVVALGLVLFAQVANAADDKVSASYAYHAPLPVVAGAPLQRVPLTAEVLVRLQDPGYADVRVFNAQGQALPMALLPSRGVPAERRKTPLKPLPVLGVPGALNVTGVSLQVDPAGQARVVGLSGTPDKASASLLAVLLDTRAMHDLATELVLDVEMPDQQPVTFRLEDSADLKTWDAVSEHVAYRSPGDASTVSIPIDHAGFADRYLRVTWQSSTKLLAPVRVRGATLTTERAVAVQVERAEISGAKLVSTHDLEFGLPFGTRVKALYVSPNGQDTIIPVRILGRDDSEQPWTLMATGTAYKMQGIGDAQTGPAIPLSGANYRFIRLEADKRTGGFLVLPSLHAQFEPREIAVLITGSPPYTIAAGLKGASSAYLPLDSLMAASPNTKVADLPLVPMARSIPVVSYLGESEGATSARSMLLWAALLGGTAVLGFIAWLASRKPAGPASGIE